MMKTEVEAFLQEFDAALVEAFPGPEPLSVLLVGAACFLLQDITVSPTDTVDVMILEMLGSQQRTLVFHSPTADKLRRIIRAIGKLMLGRPELDGGEITVLCQTLAIENRVQAQQLVDHSFPSSADQATYRLPSTLESTFGK